MCVFVCMCAVVIRKFCLGIYFLAVYTSQDMLRTSSLRDGILASENPNDEQPDENVPKEADLDVPEETDSDVSEESPEDTGLTIEELENESCSAIVVSTTLPPTLPIV